MSKEELLTYISDNSTAGDWFMSTDGTIRSTEQLPLRVGRCPICWVGTRLGKNPLDEAVNYWPVASLLDLADAMIAADAADNFLDRDLDGRVAAFRLELLKACKIGT